MAIDYIVEFILRDFSSKYVFDKLRKNFNYRKNYLNSTFFFYIFYTISSLKREPTQSTTLWEL